MEMLRDKNKQLERRLAELLRYGHENDSIATKFNRWTDARDRRSAIRTRCPQTISKGLCEIFDVPHAALRVWDVDEAYRQADFARQVGEEVRIFTSSLADAVLRREHRLRGGAVAGVGEFGVGGVGADAMASSTPRTHDRIRSRCSRCAIRKPARTRRASACS